MGETIDIDRLEYPCDIAEVIGLSKNEINWLKRKGCPFFGKKTTVRWVRDWLARQAGAVPVEAGHEPEHGASLPH